MHKLLISHFCWYTSTSLPIYSTESLKKGLIDLPAIKKEIFQKEDAAIISFSSSANAAILSDQELHNGKADQGAKTTQDSDQQDIIG